MEIYKKRPIIGLIFIKAITVTLGINISYFGIIHKKDSGTLKKNSCAGPDTW